MNEVPKDLWDLTLNSPGRILTRAAKGKPLTSNFIILGMALIIAGMYLYPRYLTGDQNQQQTESTLETAVMDKSIAVLPFINLSDDPDQEYFCDGIAEDILNDLTNIGDLKVVARTSSFAFKDKNLQIVKSPG